MLKVKTIFLKGPIKFARDLQEDLWSSAEQSLARGPGFESQLCSNVGRKAGREKLKICERGRCQ